MHRYRCNFVDLAMKSVLLQSIYKQYKFRKMNIKTFTLLALLGVLSACGTPKDVAYFQGIDSVTTEQLSQMNQNYTSLICPDDMLTITVTAWDPTVVTPFNPPVYAYATQGEVGVMSSSQLQTYLVDKEGDIIFPVIGKIHAAGLSKQDFSENLRTEIAKSVPSAQVNVQIVNYKVTLLGEVSRPGSISVRNDRISILDAVGQVGDLTINANRKNILVVRDIEGEKTFGRIDITDPALFASPYYYLRQNDVVYVEPNDAKKKNAKYSQAQQYSVTVFSAIISSMSLITSMVLTIVSQTKK